MNPSIPIEAGQAAAQGASSFWQSTGEFAGRTWTWIRNAAATTWSGIVAAATAIWTFAAVQLSNFGSWLAQNPLQASVVFVIGAAIGVALHAILSRCLRPAGTLQDQLDAANQQVQTLQQQVNDHPQAIQTAVNTATQNQQQAIDIAVDAARTPLLAQIDEIQQKHAQEILALRAQIPQQV